MFVVSRIIQRSVITYAKNNNKKNVKHFSQTLLKQKIDNKFARLENVINGVKNEIAKLDVNMEKRQVKIEKGQVNLAKFVLASSGITGSGLLGMLYRLEEHKIK
ncbi:hypothetical protein C1645_814964 [Glomus cerebriforme]|uniref:Uncharacterized protein n=1 Tax=Glomus cerebriforme TaxID=658196 RepID=A0A397TET8_9GLOM|nr:hypothetical protein C1645_814964 [Glomus cerebriforme]